MRYKGRWVPDPAMTEITLGNTVKAVESEKVIHADTFLPNHLERVREPQISSQGHIKRSRQSLRRKHRAALLRLTLQVIAMMTMLVLILAIDTVTSLAGTVMMMVGIIGCAGILFLLDDKEP